MELSFKRLLEEGKPVPKWYGISHINFDQCVCICYPIPLNLLVRLWYNIVNHIRYPKGITKDSQTYWNLRRKILDEFGEVLHRKWTQGYDMGLKDCRMQIEEFVSIQEAIYHRNISNALNLLREEITIIKEKGGIIGGDVIPGGPRGELEKETDYE